MKYRIATAIILAMLISLTMSYGETGHVQSGLTTGGKGQGLLDHNGNGTSDLAVFDSNTGDWYVRELNGLLTSWDVNWGWAGAVPVPGDYDGDGTADLAVFDSLTGKWYVRSSTNEVLLWAETWGWSGAIPVSGDYDGDGIADLAVFDSNTGDWYVRSVGGTVLLWAERWGFKGTIPVPGDYDGNGSSDLAVIESSTGKWYVRTLEPALLAWAQDWGWPGAIPVSGDYDGDSTDDLALFDSNTGNWYVKSLTNGVILWAQNWGWPGAVPVSGDYNGDGASDLAVFDGDTGDWYVYSLSDGVVACPERWGFSGAVPVGRPVYYMSAYAGQNATMINSTYWTGRYQARSYEVDKKTILNVGLGLNEIPSCYNVIITAFIISQDNELILADNGCTSAEMQTWNAALSEAGTRSIVSFGGETFRGYPLKSDAEKAAFVAEIKQIVDTYGFKGLDVDLEGGAITSGTIDGTALGAALKELKDYYTGRGVDFWLTAAPEFPYLIGNPTFYGSIFSGAGGVEEFDYIWPQSYNQGGDGVSGPTGAWVTPANSGMSTFCATLAWALGTTDGYAMNGQARGGVFIPLHKLVIGIPATEGSAGSGMDYVLTPSMIQETWGKMAELGATCSGFMNWSANWDATTINDGDLSTGYSHSPWDTGNAISETLWNCVR